MLDRFIQHRLQKDEREIKIGFTVSALIILALLANVIYLNYIVINSLSNKPAYPIAVMVSTPTPTPSATSTPTPAPTPTAVNTTDQNSFKDYLDQGSHNLSARDYYLNLGSGTNQSTDWADVQGTLVTLDLGQYKNIKEVHLETTINVPTANGQVSVRLFNKTDGYAVWNSERTVQSQVNGDLLISQNIIYDRGPKMYQVQMKSQLGVLANLLQSRLRVTAE